MEMRDDQWQTSMINDQRIVVELCSVMLSMAIDDSTAMEHDAMMYAM